MTLQVSHAAVDDRLLCARGVATPMPDWTAYLVYDFRGATLFALWFLLGSQAVAGLSDLRRMSAQREFLEIWVAFTLVVLGIDGWRVYQGEADLSVYGVKWGLIIVAGLLSWEHVGVLFRLARGDVWGIVAVCSLFNPLFVVIYVVLLKVADLVMRPGLRAFGSGSAYPFIPVVLVATLATVALIALDLVERVLPASVLPG